MKPFVQLNDETNHAGVEFLFTELDSCDTFLNVADTTQQAETRARNHQNALAAYQSLLRYRPRVLFDSTQESEFETKLTELTHRLVKAGVLCKPSLP